MIGLYNLEPQYVNIALEKVRLFYESRGEKVTDCNPLEGGLYEKVYCSSIFTWTDKSYVTDFMTCGGSGFDLTTELPAGIEKMKPKINIGFTTRGCIRKCPFCVVPEKEGPLRIVGNIYDFWDRKSKKITILDNNILAARKHFQFIATQIRDVNLRVDFNQGLDYRLLDPELLQELKTLRYEHYKFAFDNPAEERGVREAIDMLRTHGIKWSMWLVLVGFNTTYKEDLHRLNLLKKLDQRAYVQRYNGRTNKFYSQLSSWANSQRQFMKRSFEDFLKARGRNIREIMAAERIY